MYLGCPSHTPPSSGACSCAAPAWDLGCGGALCPPPAHLGVVPPIGGDGFSPQGLLLLKKSLGK